MRSFALWAGAIALGMLLVAILLPVGGLDRPTGLALGCLTNLKRLAYAETMYAEDHDDRLPLARNWANASLNYLESRTVAFNCPSLGQSGAFGHAFYRPAAGLKMSELRDASSFLMLFDSNELGLNAVGHLAQIPSKGRHPDDRSTFAFCDGHAKQLSRRNLFELLRHQAVAP